jgi:hypothetical protein
MDLEGGTAQVMKPIARELQRRGHTVTIEADRNEATAPDVTEYDLVHCWNMTSLTPQVRETAKKLIVTIHHMPLRYEQKYVDALRELRPDVIHVVDPWVVRQLGRHGLYNVFLIPQAIDQKYAPEPLPAEFTIGFIGNSESGLKRFEVIEEAARKLGIRCVGHKNPPWASDATIEQAYRMMSCYVCASWEEGGPVPVLEALQMGRPVVTTPVGNAALFVHPGNNGEFFNGDLGTLCEAIERVRDGIDWYAKNATETPLNPPSMVCELYERVYKEVIG